MYGMWWIWILTWVLCVARLFTAEYGGTAPTLLTAAIYVCMDVPDLT